MFRFLLILSIIGVASCNSSGKRDASLMQQATGKPGDMILIMDSMQWKAELGQEIRAIFRAEVPGLPREEPMFDVTWVHPNKNFRLLTQIRNLVYVFTLDQHTPGTRVITDDFSQATLDTIRQDTSFYISVEQDMFARGQTVMYLFSRTEEVLIDHLQADGKKIIDYFNTVERNRLVASIMRTKTTKGLTEFLQAERRCALTLPIGFQLADNREDFIWFRKIEIDADKDIFISWKPYTSEYQLHRDSLIEWRNEIARKYLFEDPEQPDSYLVTEQSVPFKPVIARQVNLNSNYASELRGLWKTNNHTMGGPFISYALIDEPHGLLYYIEGFTFSPGKRQREIVRELQTILWTFKTSADLSPSKSGNSR